jgi:hypothetical protein
LEYLYHYTDIERLALIVRHRTIRFSRFDKLDDITESKVFTDYSFAPYLFTSCWTADKLENIPMWYMYAKKMTGVRLKLPKDPFKKYKLKSDPSRGLTVTGDWYNLLPPNRLVTDEYIIMNNPFSEKDYFREVEYVDDPSIYFKNFAVFSEGENGRTGLRLESTYKLGKYKSIVWSFQKEVRYLLVILPSAHGMQEANLNVDKHQELINHQLTVIKRQIKNKIEHFDLELSDCVDDIEITIGPLCNNDDMVRVKSLIEDCTENGKLVRSVLTGTIQ